MIYKTSIYVANMPKDKQVDAELDEYLEHIKVGDKLTFNARVYTPGEYEKGFVTMITGTIVDIDNILAKEQFTTLRELVQYVVVIMPEQQYKTVFSLIEKQEKENKKKK